MAITWGSFLGMVAGLKGGRLDELIMRTVDTFLAIPFMIFLLLNFSSACPQGRYLYVWLKKELF